MNIELDSPEVKARVAKELASRMFMGVFIYPILWLVVGLGGDIDHSHPTLFWSALSVFTLFTAIRGYHIRSFNKINLESTRRWVLQHTLLMLPHIVLWGLLLGFALTKPNSTFVLLMTFSTAGVVPGGIYNFAPNFKVSMTFILSMLLPALIASSILTQQWFFFLLLCVYAIFIISMAHGQYRDYWRYLENQLKLEAQSRTDALTQLENRRYFDEKLDEFCHLSSRNHEKLTIMLVDCDFFKNINDSYGHDVGDECLKHIAKLLKEALPRATDVCARYGGEEFSIILAGTDLEGAKLVGERIRKLLESRSFNTNGDTIEITVSIGSVSRQINQFIPDLPFNLFKQADKALYQAKENGRNRCVFFVYDKSSDEYQFAAETAGEPRKN